MYEKQLIEKNVGKCNKIRKNYRYKFKIKTGNTKDYNKNRNKLI